MQELINKAKKIGLDISQQAAQKMLDYCDLMYETNSQLNLTAIEKSQAIDKHFIDSLVSHKYISGNTADIGTGAGFPGVPLAVVFDSLQFVLLDSTNKKLEFIKTACNKLGIQNVSTLHCRVEDYGQGEGRQRFDTVVSRAVANLSVLCEYGLPLLKIGGKLVAYKSDTGEIDAAQNAIKILGGTITETHSLTLPDTDTSRSLIVIQKTTNTPSKYPRASNKPRTNPL